MTSTSSCRSLYHIPWLW